MCLYSDKKAYTSLREASGIEQQSKVEKLDSRSPRLFFLSWKVNDVILQEKAEVSLPDQGLGRSLARTNLGVRIWRFCL